MSDRKPAWDGEGTDPWLPDRLAALADVVAAEAHLFAEFLRFLKRWLRLVRERTREARYDPTVSAALKPAWHDAMTEYATDDIYAVAETAYTNVTGDQAYPPNMADAARRRALGRRNQLVHIADEVYVLIQNAVAEAITTGASGERLAETIDDILDVTASPRWENRATVVARTESIGALNAGRNDGHGEITRRLGGTWEKVWIATLDDATRPTHREADGQRIPFDALYTVGLARLRHPGDPTGPADEIIQCRCTQVLVRPGQTIDHSRRRA